MILLIDNYDSFVYNLSRYFTEMGCETLVCRNDSLTLNEIEQMCPQAIVLSPGPGTPQQAGICIDVVRQFSGKIPLLGVCLGHQAIAAAFGAKIVRAVEPVHGRTSLIEHQDSALFTGLPNPFPATRYHSLVVAEKSLPPQLQVTARTMDGAVMAIQHTTAVVHGLQFHPESILTQSGHAMLRSYLKLAGIPATEVTLRELTASPQATDAESEPPGTAPVIAW